MKLKIFGVSFRHNRNNKRSTASPPNPEVELVDFYDAIKSVSAEVDFAKNEAKSNEILSTFKIPDSKSSKDSPVVDFSEDISAQVYNSLSLKFDSAETGAGIMPRYPETLSEASPLRGGSSSGDFTDDLFPEHISSRTRRKTIRWAVFLGAVALSVMIILGITSVALEYLQSHPDNSSTNANASATTPSPNASALLSGNTEDIDEDTGYALVPGHSKDGLETRVEYPIPDVKTRAEREFRKDIFSNFEYSVPKSGQKSVPILKSSATYDPIPFIFPIPLLKMANKSTLEDGLRAGQEALAQRQRTETRIHQLGFSIGKGAPEAYSQYRTESNDSTRQHDESRKMSLIGFSMDRASRIIAKRLNLTKEEAQQGIPVTSDGQLDVNVKPNTWCAEQTEQVCNLTSVYRSADGSCNSLNHALWGATLQPYRRILLPDYADGISRPRIAKDGTSLPNARYISQTLFKNTHQDDPTVSMMFPLWAEFIEHDMDYTVQSVGEMGEMITCCENGTLLEIQHPECFPIYMSEEDQFYNQVSRHCMTVLRSAAAPSCTFGPREQFSKTTAFLDGSTIYGSSGSEAHAVRGNSSEHSGRLKMSYAADGQAVLYALTSHNDHCNVDEEILQNHFCFASGDDRVNQNLGLTSMHLVWTRQHNLIASKLSAQNSHWDDEQLFQESKRIVIAQMQHITFNEYLPLLLGPEMLKSADLKLLDKGYYEGYAKLINPGMSNAVSAAASHFRHSMIQGLTQLVGPGGKNFIQTHKLFFNPFPLWTSGNLESLLRGYATAAAAKADTSFTEQVTNHMFQAHNSSIGYDLAAIDIQQGRDHGLPGYTEWRKICGLDPVNNFTDLHNLWNGSTLELVGQIYKSVEDIDLFVGGLAETPISGGVVGPTFACLLADQFSRIRKGDRFWYEGNIQLRPFTLAQLDVIRQTTLARIVCDNTDSLNNIQASVLRQISPENPIQTCGQISKEFDYSIWKESKPLLEIGLEFKSPPVSPHSEKNTRNSSSFSGLRANESDYADAEEMEEYAEVRAKSNYSIADHNFSPFENMLDKHANLSTSERPPHSTANLSTTESSLSSRNSSSTSPVELQLLTNPFLNHTESISATFSTEKSSKGILLVWPKIQRNDSDAMSIE